MACAKTQMQRQLAMWKDKNKPNVGGAESSRTVGENTLKRKARAKGL